MPVLVFKYQILGLVLVKSIDFFGVKKKTKFSTKLDADDDDKMPTQDAGWGCEENLKGFT